MPRSLPILPESKRAEMVAAARSLVGVRWRHQGRSVRGVDCLGAVAVCLSAIGVEGEDERNYEREPDGVRLYAGLSARLGEPVQRWRVGDIALMRWATSNGLHSHVGILAQHNGQWTLIHAYAREKRVVEHRLAGDWMKRVTDVFSLTGESP